MNEMAAHKTSARAALWRHRPRILRLAVATPVLSILALWYAAIAPGPPEFVIPPDPGAGGAGRDRAHRDASLETLKSAGLGFLLANAIGIGLAMLFVRPLFQRTSCRRDHHAHIPYVALASVLVLAFGDGLRRSPDVALAGSSGSGQHVSRPVVGRSDHHRPHAHSHARPWDVPLNALAVSLPFIPVAQIVGSGSIVLDRRRMADVDDGLGYVINRAMSQYRGDQVYAVVPWALLSWRLFAIQVRGAARLSAVAGAKGNNVK